MLNRAWLFVGVIEAVLVMAGFFFVLLARRLEPERSRGLRRSRFTSHYLRATTMTFAGIVACQVGTAVAARTERASLRSIGVFSNRLLLWGIAFELAVLPRRSSTSRPRPIFHTAPLGPAELAFLLPFPFVVWGADELRRWRRRLDYIARPQHRRRHSS